MSSALKMKNGCCENLFNCILTCVPYFKLLINEKHCYVYSGGTPDTIAPVVSNCPIQGIRGTAPTGASSVIVTWTEPTAIDNSGGTVTRTSNRSPGLPYPIGVTNIEYTFTDPSRNQAFCRFTVTVTGKFLQIVQFLYFGFLAEEKPQNMTLEVWSG